MFGLGGMNPKNMEKVMKQLGMQTSAIEADEVIIKCKEKDIVIANPSVQKISVGGQDSYQVSGQSQEIEKSSKLQFSDDDIKLIMEKTKCTKKQALASLEETGDIAEAILKLSE